MTDSPQILVSHITIPLSVLGFVENAKAKIASAGILKTEQELLETALDVGKKLADGERDQNMAYVPILIDTLSEELQSRELAGSTPRAVRNKCKRLTEAGFFEAIEIPSERGGRNSTRYAMQNIHRNDFESKEIKEMREQAQGHRNERTRSNKKMLNFLRESSVQLVTFVSKNRPVTETIFTGVLDRSMRFSLFDKPHGNRITSKVRVKNTDLLVQATCQTGQNSELAALPDQRVIRAVLTEVAHWIENQIDQYILDVEKPRQANLFDQDDTTEGMIIPEMLTDFQDVSKEQERGVNESVDDQTDTALTGDVETRLSQRRDEIEAIAADRIQNSFFIDVVGVAKRMGYSSPHSSSTRRFINASLRRLYETNFRLVVKGDNPSEVLEVMEMFGLDDISTDFRFLSSLKSQFEPGFVSHNKKRESTVKEESDSSSRQVVQGDQESAETERNVDPYNPEELKRVRLWNISLDPHLFNKLRNKESRKLFTAHSDIMRESSGLGQTLYNFFTQTIGRSDKSIRGKKANVFYLPLANLHNILWPTRRYHRFEDEFIDLMKSYARKGSWDKTLQLNVVSMFGYQFTLIKRENEKKQMWVRIERDPKDPLSGDNSYYNQMQRKKVMQELQEAEAENQ